MAKQSEESNQEMAVSAFCEGLEERDDASQVAVLAGGKVNEGLRIAAAVAAFTDPKRAAKTPNNKSDKIPNAFFTQSEADQKELIELDKNLDER